MLMTSNPEYIRSWAIQRGGFPTRISGSGWPRIVFADQEQPDETISWEEFFQLVDDYHLGLAYDPAPSSRNYTLMPLEEEGEEEMEPTAARKPAEDQKPADEDDGTY